VREVDDFQHAENQRQAHGDQRVDHANHDAVQQKLN